MLNSTLVVGRISANGIKNLSNIMKYQKKLYFCNLKIADLAQLVERQLPKLQVAGSRPVIRSEIFFKNKCRVY